MKKNILIFAALLWATGVWAQETGAFTDPRDGYIYKTVKIGSQTWMAENLAYKMSEGCWAYENKETFAHIYGRLYTWEAAKKACPPGWHLPSNDEWQTLVDYFGGDKKAGTALKSTKGWEDGGNGDNSSGFNALPAGYRYYRDGSFKNLGKYTLFWSSSPYGSERAWIRKLTYSYGKVYRHFDYLASGFSVRCLRD